MEPQPSSDVDPTRPRVWLPVLSAGTGVDIFTQRLADALRSLGYPVSVQTFAHGFELLPELLSRVRPPAETRVIIANSWQAAVFKRPHAALISVFHNSVYVDEMWRLMSPAQRIYHRLRIKPLERLAAHRSTTCVAPSEYTARTAAAEFGTPVVAIHNGIDTKMFRPGGERPRRQPTPADPMRLLFLGKPSVRKGIDLIGPTMQLLGDRYRLDVIGGDPGVALPHNVRVLGAMPTVQVVHQLQSADALLFPSRMEGFGFAVAEAMACGVPVVALRRSATPELISHGEDGLLCDDDDPACLAEAVRQLADDPVLYRRLASRARTKAKSGFSLERFARHYHETIQQALSTVHEDSRQRSRR